MLTASDPDENATGFRPIRRRQPTRRLDCTLFAQSVHQTSKLAPYPHRHGTLKVPSGWGTQMRAVFGYPPDILSNPPNRLTKRIFYMRHRNSPARSGRLAAGLLFGALLLGAGIVVARPEGGPGPGGDPGFDPFVERMANQLELTEAQRAEVRKILEEAQKQRDEQRRQVREKIDAVLTAEQKAKRDAAMKERVARRVERMTRQLKLTDDQVTKVSALFEEQQKNPSLTPSEMHDRLSALLTEEQRASLNRTPPPPRDDGRSDSHDHEGHQDH